MKIPCSLPMQKLSLAALFVSLSAIYSASANPVTWVGTNGVSATTNWSDSNNWISNLTAVHESPANNAASFDANTAVTSPGIVTVNVDGAYGTPGSGFAQTYGAFFGQTNGCHTVFIQPGIIWAIQAQGSTPSNGTQGLGIEVGPQPIDNNNINTANTVNTGATFTNYTTITGSGGYFYCNAGASTGGLRVEAASTVANNHYSILDMSGLGTFFMTNITGLSSSEGFYLVNGGQNSQGLIYLALTNYIYLNNNFQVGYLGSSSNTLPIGVYLGQSNYISTGANNNNLIIGYTGCANGFMQFNPALIGGPSLPTAYITGASSNQTAQICNAAGGTVPGSAVCDFTGGSVTWIGNILKIGVSGSNSFNTSANGVLTFVNGTVTFNTILVGSQTISAGAPAVGTINIGTNATLQANTSITLGATTGTVTAGTAGTININTNGTLQASIITNGGAGSTINMTNAVWDVALTSTSVTNITVANFNAGGHTNIINITSIPGFLPGGYPARFPLIATTIPANLAGASTFVLGPLPATTNTPYTGRLDISTPGLVNFVLTGGPPSLRSLTWTGTNSGGPDGIWDVGTNTDWLSSGVASVFNQADLVTFNDLAGTAQTNVSLTTTLTPTSITVSNAASLYTIGLASDPGNISGSTGLTKQGTGTLILDNAVSNSFTGGVTISGGVLQVGNNDANGNLPAGVAITDNSVLAYDQTGSVVVSNIISGSGAVISEGSGTLNLAGGNSFSGVALATNNSTLQSGSASAWGASNGTIVVASGSTFDPNGFATTRAIIVSGTGVSGNGAIVNSGVAIGDSATGLSPSITLAGNTTLSFPTRWDYGLPSGVETFSTGGQPYNLTLNGTANNTYFEWRDITADPALANIYVTAGYFGIVGSTTLGSTNYSLNILAGGGTKFYNAGTTNVVITKPVVINDQGSIQNGGGSNTIAGPLTITNSGGGQYCVFNMGTPYTLNITGPVSGNGILWMQGSGSAGTLIMSGNASAFTGGVLVPSGIFALSNVIGSGITNATGAVLAGSGTANGLVDVSGIFIPGGSNVVGTFTAAAGLTLEATSVPVINLTTTTTVGGGHNSLVAVTGNLTVNGSPTILINPLSPLVDGTYTLMTYTGSLIGAFSGVQTVAPSGYTLALNTNVAGKVELTVGGGISPASFSGPYTVSNSIFTLNGIGGTPSGTYRVYTATNVATPLTNWVQITNGSFDTNGNFNFSTPVTNGVARFYLLEEP